MTDIKQAKEDCQKLSDNLNQIMNEKLDALRAFYPDLDIKLGMGTVFGNENQPKIYHTISIKQ